MWVPKLFRNAGRSAVYKMITEQGNGFFAWNGKLYESDIVGPASGLMRRR